jgi:DNA polymerase-1
MKVLLIDGYNMLYRARAGWAKGENPIVFTFFRSFRAAVNNFKPDTVYFVLEGRPVKRIEMLGEYKAQRVYHDKDDFHRQKKLIIKMLKEHFPVHVVRHPSYECDDVLANLAYITHKEDECTVISSDTDFYQMLQNHKNVRLYNPIQKRFIEAPETDYVSWKALKGDSADNIPGFPGIGNKRATKLMKDPELLDEFLSREAHREKFERNRFLIRFHDMTADLPDIERNFGEGNWSGIFNEFSEMEFNSIVSEKFWPKFVNTFDSLV